jgi:hypothetical protein
MAQYCWGRTITLHHVKHIRHQTSDSIAGAKCLRLHAMHQVLMKKYSKSWELYPNQEGAAHYNQPANWQTTQKHKTRQGDSW